MPLYEVTAEGSSGGRRLRSPPWACTKRADLQRLLRDGISALDEDLLIIAEEFGNCAREQDP